MDALAPSATCHLDIVVELSNVWKVYRQVQRAGRLRDIIRGLIHPQVRQVEALRGISLRIRRGEIVAYAGPNGAGKSTTIKLLTGLLAPDAGRIRVLGMDPIRDRIPYVQRIGVVFGQRTELWWDHSVAASFEWKRVVWDIPSERYHRTLGFLREILGLDDFYQTLARELSLGQRMRAELGLALLHEPELLFLDEPTIGLDVLAKRQILGFIQQLNRERRVTVVVTSHDMDDLERLAGRIVLIHRGSIAFDGDFARLRRALGDRRHLLIETITDHPPRLEGAVWLHSQNGRHEYVFDAAAVSIAALLDQAAAQTRILDVETHRVPIDDVIATLYQRWQTPPSQSIDAARAVPEQERADPSA
jgi:ABC-2 type transport system ATP-binding protein